MGAGKWGKTGPNPPADQTIPLNKDTPQLEVTDEKSLEIVDN